MSAEETFSPNGVPKRHRVGYLLRMYPRFSQTFVVNEILELERQGVDLRIASLRKPNEGVFHESISRVRAHVDYFPDRVMGQVRKNLRTQWSRWRQSPRRYRRAAAIVRKYETENWFEMVQAVELLRWVGKRRVGHVHVHFGTDEATVALLAAVLGNLSYSLTLHAFDIFRDTVDRSLLAQKINHSRFAVTVCESNRRYMIENLPGVDPDKVIVNYNGIDLTRFNPDGGLESVAASETVQPSVARKPMSIFSVGRLIEKKGFIHLIHAVAHLRDDGFVVSCDIAGDGREQATLERAIKELDLRKQVRLIGPIDQDRVRQRLREAACFALPCVCARDGNVDALPTVLLESLASGCPTVSTRLSGIPEILEDNVSGLLVEPEDSRSLATAIRRVLEDGALSTRLAEGGLQRASERFDVTANVAVMRELFTAATQDARVKISPKRALSSTEPLTRSRSGREVA